MTADRKFHLCLGWFLAGVFSVVILSACESTHETVRLQKAEDDGHKPIASVLYGSTQTTVRKFCDPGDGITRYVIYLTTHGEGVTMAVRPALHTECRE